MSETETSSAKYLSPIKSPPVPKVSCQAEAEDRTSNQPLPSNLEQCIFGENVLLLRFGYGYTDTLNMDLTIMQSWAQTEALSPVDQSSGELLTNRYIVHLMADVSRIQLMKEQINQFWEKVEASKRSFALDVFVEMVRNFSNRASVRNQGGIDTVHNLRKLVDKETNRVRIMYGSQQVKWDPEILYFNWFFDFFDYLRELKQIFHKNIMEPLEKYAGNTAIMLQGGQDLVEQIFGRNRAADGGESNAAGPDNKLEQELVDVRRELSEVASTYNTEGIDRCHKSIQSIVHRLTRLLETEWDHNLMLFETESADIVLKYESSGVDPKLIRLMPDLLLKFEKVAKMAAEWVEEDSRKMQDMPQTMEKLKHAEQKLLKKLEDVSERIKIHEIGLSKETKQLENLINQNRNADQNLNQLLSVTDREISRLKEELRIISRERESLLSKVQQATGSGEELDRNYLVALRLEQNKFHHYALQRDLSARLYHKNVLEGNVSGDSIPTAAGTEVLPNVRRCANKLESDYEYLQDLIARRQIIRDHIEREIKRSRARPQPATMVYYNEPVYKEPMPPSAGRRYYYSGRGTGGERVYYVEVPAGSTDWLPPIDGADSYQRRYEPAGPPTPPSYRLGGRHRGRGDRLVQVVYMPPADGGVGKRTQSLDGRYVQVDQDRGPDDPYERKLKAAAVLGPVHGGGGLADIARRQEPGWLHHSLRKMDYPGPLIRLKRSETPEY